MVIGSKLRIPRVKSENLCTGGDKFKTYTMTELYGVNAQTGQYTSLNVENKITSALKYVSSETQQKAYLIKGHNEIAVDGAKTKLESTSR